MSISAHKVGAHGDEDHGQRHIDATVLITHEPPPTGHPANGSLDHPASRKDLKALCSFAAADDLDDEIQIGRLVHQPQALIGAVGEQMLRPWRTHLFAQRII